jgi:hypothetical protein
LTHSNSADGEVRFDAADSLVGVVENGSSEHRVGPGGECAGDVLARSDAA